MTTQDIIDHLKAGRPVTAKVVKEIVVELEGTVVLEEALKRISNLYWQDAPCPQEMRDIAREALGERCPNSKPPPV